MPDRAALSLIRPRASRLGFTTADGPGYAGDPNDRLADALEASLDLSALTVIPIRR
jgi:hypothetical protein